MNINADDISNEKTKVDKDLYVNDATLELLRRRIEADVKKGFFTSIGAPIGGAGIIAILYVLFSWIPTQVGKIIEELPGIQRTVQESVIDYLEDEKKGKQFIRQQVDQNSEKFVSRAVAEYMASDEVAHILRAEVETKTNDYFAGDEGRNLVEGLIKTYMTSAEVRQQIRNAVDSALTPILTSLSHDIDKSLNALVYDIPQLSGTEQIGKDSLFKLHQFLGSAEAAKIKARDNPVVLTFTIGLGHYDSFVIKEYLNLLQEYFAEQFRYVAVLDSSKRFLALLPVAPFSAVIEQDSTLLGLLNGQNIGGTQAFLRDRFGPGIDRRVQTNQVVIDVLRTMSAWGSTMQSDFVAVVNVSGEMVGITNKQKILDGCLDKIST